MKHSSTIHLLAASGGRRRYQQTNRECGSACACGIGFILVVLFGLAVLFSVPSVYYPYDIILAIIGAVLLVGGILVLSGTVRERRRVLEATKNRDGVSLDVISADARVPYDRTKEYLTYFIAAGLLKGGIVDDTYVASMKAERIDSRTVRCPHCDTELELPEEN